MMEKLKLEDKVISYSIIRSARKSIAIEIDRNGELRIRTPKQISKKDIEELILERLNWILEHQKKVKKVRYREGEEFLYEGKVYILHIQNNREYREPKIEIQEDKLVVKTYSENEALIEEILQNWYYRKAEEKILKSVHCFETKSQRMAAKITIKNQKTRWGSCSTKGNLNFNWRLILLPSELLDYVVIHELCHFKQMNHSSLFWQEVASVLPDYKERRRKLREYEKIVSW